MSAKYGGRLGAWMSDLPRQYWCLRAWCLWMDGVYAASFFLIPLFHRGIGWMDGGKVAFGWVFSEYQVKRFTFVSLCLFLRERG